MTPAQLALLTAALLVDNRDLRDVAWEDLGQGQYIASLKFRWWAWLTLQPLHVKAIDKAHKVIDAMVPGNMIVVRTI